MYKNFIFDLYGTLIDLTTNEEKDELWAKLSLFYSYNGAKYEKGELKEDYCIMVKKFLSENTTTDYPDTKVNNIFKILYNNKDVNASDELVMMTTKLFRILSTEDIGIYDGVKETLSLLKSSGRKLFILSNGQREFSIPEIKYLGIYDYFDGIYCSADVGICKPDVNFYKYLIEKEKLNISECIMIGNDHTTDIKGANDIGMDCVYIHSNHSNKIYNNIKANLKIWDGNFYRIKEIIA